VVSFLELLQVLSAGFSKREPLLKIEAGSFYKLDALSVIKHVSRWMEDVLILLIMAMILTLRH